MRRVSFFLLFIFSLTSCNQSGFTIEGTVSHPLFEEGTVYLVALDGPISKQVDSTRVKEGKFSFRLKADSMEVRILRMAPKYPETVQDLVLVAEKGELRAELGKISKGEGTSLNDKLQQWKNRKDLYDSTLWNLYNLRDVELSSEKQQDSLRALSDSIYKEFLDGNIKFMHENLFNGIGLFVFKLYFHSLTAEEKNDVVGKTGNLYFEHDAELKQRVQAASNP